MLGRDIADSEKNKCASPRSISYTKKTQTKIFCASHIHWFLLEINMVLSTVPLLLYGCLCSAARNPFMPCFERRRSVYMYLFL